MEAICVGEGVCNLITSEVSGLLFVDGRVRILAILRELRDVEHVNIEASFPELVDGLLEHLHHPAIRPASPIPFFGDWFCFFIAVVTCDPTPILGPAAKRCKIMSW